MVEGEVRSKISGNVCGERLSARRKKGIGDLHVRSPLAHERDDRLRLQTFTNGRCVHPEKWTGSITLVFAPIFV
jgi:hypothetical protein